MLETDYETYALSKSENNFIKGMVVDIYAVFKVFKSCLEKFEQGN